MTRYSTHPMEANFQERERSRKEHRMHYWNVLYALRSEYKAAYPDYNNTSNPRLDYWVNETYGFQMGTDGQGHYTDSYTVTDPKKFMLVQIKHGLR